MTKRRKRQEGQHQGAGEPPREIPMTDLESEMENGHGGRSDSHAAGTPGGGTALGGLAGTNFGDGSPDDVALEDAFGAGVHDHDHDPEEDSQAYGGPAGGAVGGTPANGRERGGRARGMPRIERERPGDSTIGS